MVWGHFYANPNDVTWGSQNNPDLFMKIWFDVSGRVDVNFFHVSVPDIEVYSNLPIEGAYDRQGTTVMNNRYIRHEYWSGGNFAGTYSFFEQYDLNISDGVALGIGTVTLEVTRIDSNNLSAQIFGNNPDEGSYSGQFPFVMSGNIATLPTRPYDMGNGNLWDFLILSDGNNMVCTGIGQEKDNLADISLSVANWLRIPQPVTVDSFVGTWGGIFYSDPNLSNTTDGFSVANESMTISKVDADTIAVNIRNESFSLDVANSQATLTIAPVTGVSAIYHALSIVTDGSGLSFYMVATELYDFTDVSVTIGLATKQ